MAPVLTYTPAADYNGSDSFTFKANDGTLDSNVATVSITVVAVNDAPIAASQSVTTDEDTAKAITLSATGREGSPLTYAIVAAPAHGALSGAAPALTYTPTANYNGADSFTFKANDGALDSNVATVSITVVAVNDAPVAASRAVTTNEDTAKAITLSATDVEGSPLTYAIVTAPAHGTLSGSAPALTYTPAADYNGADSFTFKANDGALDSNVATVSITVDRGERRAGGGESSRHDERGHSEGDHAERDRRRGLAVDLRDRRRARARHAERHRAGRDLHARGELQRCRQLYVQGE